MVGKVEPHSEIAFSLSLSPPLIPENKLGHKIVRRMHLSPEMDCHELCFHLFSHQRVLLLAKAKPSDFFYLPMHLYELKGIDD
jgi:hypothetical protein